MDVHGVALQKSLDLETTDKQVARIKLRQLVQEAAATVAAPELAEQARRVETFAEAAERIVGYSTIRTKARAAIAFACTRSPRSVRSRSRRSRPATSAIS